MSIDERVIEALRLQWDAIDALDGKVEVVVRALEEKGQHSSGLFQAREDVRKTKDSLKTFVQGLQAK